MLLSDKIINKENIEFHNLINIESEIDELINEIELETNNIGSLLESSESRMNIMEIERLAQYYENRKIKIEELARNWYHIINNTSGFDKRVSTLVGKDEILIEKIRSRVEDLKNNLRKFVKLRPLLEYTKGQIL